MSGKKKQVAQAPPTPSPAAAPKAAPPTPEPAAPARKSGAADSAPTSAASGTDFTGVPAQASGAGSGPPFAQNLTLSPQFLPQRSNPLAPPLQLIDWSAMRAPFTSRGLPLSREDGNAIETNWINTYRQMRFTWGFPEEIAIKITNLGTAFAYNKALSFTNPTLEEQFDRSLEKTLPQGQSLRTIVVPVLTPDTTSWIVEKVTGKKLDFTF